MIQITNKLPTLVSNEMYLPVSGIFTVLKWGITGSAQYHYSIKRAGGHLARNELSLLTRWSPGHPHHLAGQALPTRWRGHWA